MPQHRNYSGSLMETSSGDRRPRQLDEIVTLIRETPPGETLLWRVNGHSLHHQALTRGTLVFLDQLPHRITIRPNARIAESPSELSWATMRITGWTPWECAVRAALRIEPSPARWDGVWDLSGEGVHAEERATNSCIWSAPHCGARYAPYVVPSSGRISVAGSLSADTIWRWSTLFGHEARSVLWLDILIYSGDPPARTVSRLRLFNPQAGVFEHRSLHQEPNGEPPVEFASTREENDRWFNAVVGGFGLIAPIVEATYLLLDVSDQNPIEFADFVLSPARTLHIQEPLPARDATMPTEAVDRRKGVPDHPHLSWDELHEIRPGAASCEPETTASARDRSASPPPREPGPDYPHAPPSELGKVGASLATKALTWMWAFDHETTIFDDLVVHHRSTKFQTGPIALPRRVEPDVVTHFGLYLANRILGPTSIVGNLAFGRAPDAANAFRMWDRRYSRDNLGLVVAALPWLAITGEEAVFATMFHPCLADTERGKPQANPIPEFAMFLEGHGIALAEMEPDLPQTVQQCWAIPLPNDLDDEVALAQVRATFSTFMHALAQISREIYDLGLGDVNPVRIQICDVKVIPPSDALLGSAHGSAAIAVTVTVEDGKDYGKNGWGDPKKSFAKLTQDFSAVGVRLHLTKNLFVDRALLREQYRAQIAEFRSVKSELDPSGLYHSSLAEMLWG